MERLYDFMVGITRDHASTVTNGKSDAARALKELSRQGSTTHQGTFYSIKREDGRYMASIDDPRGTHGFYGAPSKGEAMTWLAKRIDHDMLPLCTNCHELKATEGDYCYGCDDMIQDLRNDEFLESMEGDGE